MEKRTRKSSSIHSIRRIRWIAALAGLAAALVLAIVLAATLLPGSVVLAQSDDAGETGETDDSEGADEQAGYSYTVQQGDSWGTVAQETGLSVTELKDANPDAVRSTDWLNVGEELFIPTEQDEPRETVVVRRGESWTIIADRIGIPVGVLKAANPRSLRTNDLLFVGEKLLVPPIQTEDEPDEEGVQDGDEDSAEEGETDEDVADAGEDEAGEDEESDESAPASDIDADEDSDSDPEADASDPDASDPDSSGEEADESPASDGDDTDPETEESDADPDDASDDVETESDSSDTGSDTEADEEADEAASDELDSDELESGETYAVQPGESWNSIANALGLTSEALQEANPQLIRPGLVLFLGDILNVPEAGDATDDQAAPGSDDDNNAENEDAESDDAESDDTESDDTESDDAGDGVSEDDAESDPESDPADSAELDVEASADLECPASFEDFPDVLTELLNSPDATSVDLEEFLGSCDATLADSLIAEDLTGDDLEDLVVAYVNPESESASLESDLLIFTGTEEGYELDYRANASGEVRILATEDINDDDQADVVWIDTTCGASTCFDTVMVYSWDGSEWSSWTEGNIIMAYADIALVDESDEGEGSELVLDGGVYGSVGAGPQRSRTEVWGSVGGTPYSLLSTAFAESNCLYHIVLDANRAFLNAPEQGFDEAEALYTEAIGNEDLVKCWVRDNEMDELRSFAYYRLALIAGYQGLPEVASDLVGALAAIFPDSVYANVADVWLTTYEESEDVAQACETTLDYVSDAPEAWEMFADYGYANPEFAPEDVCPVVDVEIASEDEDTADTGQSDTGQSDEESDETDEAGEDIDEGTDEADAADNAGADQQSDSDGEEATADVEPTATPEPEEEPAAGSQGSTGGVAAEDASAPDSATDSTGSTAAIVLPEDCPDNVDRFGAALGDFLNSGAEQADLESWLRDCDALADDRGIIAIADLTGDGNDDVVAMPTILSDLGYGPGGTQGALLVYHADGDGSYTLAYEPEIFGNPELLGTDDVNADGRADLAWTIESCSTFCVLEAQMATWNGSAYRPTIEPGAVIAEGTALFESPGADVAGADVAGDGETLVLSGGVSGVADGGLDVPHDETWRSIDGTPYQRINWTYDRDADGNDCMGLRLVEADVAMEAGESTGYEAAVDLYAASLDNSLAACSLFGTPADTELFLLQGLASFRLMQAQTYAGDSQGAEATLQALQSGQPESDYAETATTWLSAYAGSGNAQSACDEILPILKANDDLWRITDEYGYNHPALAAEQICFVP